MVSTETNEIHPPDDSSTISGTYLIYLTIHQGRRSLFFWGGGGDLFFNQ